jgi:hypothetical protein
MILATGRSIVIGIGMEQKLGLVNDGHTQEL